MTTNSEFKVPAKKKVLAEFHNLPATKEELINEGFITEYFGDKECRWAQVALRNGIIRDLSKGCRTILAVLPTGGGKTITSAITLGDERIRTILGVKNRPLRVIFMAHIHRLLTQAERTFAEMYDVELNLRTPFTTIPDDELEYCDIIVIDEAHHEAMSSIQNQLDRTRTKPIIGFTATKDRADGMVIKFESVLEPCTREQAVKEGWLAETTLYSIIDTSGKDKVDIIKKIWTQYHHLMGKAITFVRTRSEVAELTDFYNNSNVGRVAVGLLHQTPQEMDRVLDQYSDGEIHDLLNCSKIGEGVDVKGCTTGILGRQFRSYPQLNQYIGRTARPDTESIVFELINPLTGTNLDTTVVVGTPKRHVLVTITQKGEFIEREFNKLT